MKVLYRLTSINSINKIRPVELDKQGLIKLCMDSFVEAFKSVEPFIYFIIDKPTIELVELCDNIPLDHEMEILHTDDWNSGNIASFHRQVDIARETDDDVFFLEDDYFFLPNAGEKMLEGLKKYEYVSPYHHPSKEPKSDVIDGWQLIPSTTLTFATNPKYLPKDIKEFGWAEEQIWAEIWKNYRLAQPIPSLATHMETPFLAPSVDWNFEGTNA